MASLKYLWKNRASFPFGSTSFLKAWAKRISTLPVLLQRNYLSYSLKNDGADINDTAEIGEVKINGNRKLLKVGQQSFLGRVYLALHDDIEIGERVCINDGVQLLTASHDVADPNWGLIKGKIKINNYAWIGTGATILPGVEIGYGAVIGAGAMVTKSVHDHQIVVGNPARPITKKRVENLQYNPCEFLAENRAWLIG